MNILIRLLCLSLIGFILIDGSYAAERKTSKGKTTGKGERKPMKTYLLGRLAIDLPPDFRVVAQTHAFRLVKIEEIPIPRTPTVSTNFAEVKWQERIEQIKNLRKPKGIKEVIVNQQTLQGLGRWGNSVLYYGDWMSDDEGYLDVLVDYGTHLTLFKIDGMLQEKESMRSWMLEVIRAYRPMIVRTATSNAFYTEQGTIDLPYKRQERTYARFAGPMEMILTVEMMEIHNERNKKGLTKRTAAAIAAGIMRNLDIKAITARERVVAGLSGEEEIIQGQDRARQHLRFEWEYLGKAESGSCRAIQINLETVPDNREEKTNIWNGILGSIRPANQ